jgi:hypothetical protein
VLWAASLAGNRQLTQPFPLFRLAAEAGLATEFLDASLDAMVDLN